jgi:3-isopropylmalate dehydrogenase
MSPKVLAAAKTYRMKRLTTFLDPWSVARGAGYAAAGDPLPPATLDLCRHSDAILHGAAGVPEDDAGQSDVDREASDGSLFNSFSPGTGLGSSM